MPAIRPYSQVLQAITSMGMVCNYYNAGAFGFGRGQPIVFRGWIGPDDPTIRPAAIPSVRRIAPPFEPNLARLAHDAWLSLSDGMAWILPMSHWAFELDHGSRDWIPDALAEIGIDSTPLLQLNNAAAIEFQRSEGPALVDLTSRLLTRLTASDFAMVLPGVPLACTIHHHKQLWWVCQSQATIDAIDALAPPDHLG